MRENPQFLASKPSSGTNGFALRRSEALSARTGSADLGFSQTRAPSRVEKGRVACQSAVSWPKIGNNSARAARDVRCRCLGKRYAHRDDESAVSNVHRGSSSIAWPLRFSVVHCSSYKPDCKRGKSDKRTGTLSPPPASPSTVARAWECGIISARSLVPDLPPLPATPKNPPIARLASPTSLRLPSPAASSPHIPCSPLCQTLLTKRFPRRSPCAKAF